MYLNNVTQQLVALIALEVRSLPDHCNPKSSAISKPKI